MQSNRPNHLPHPFRWPLIILIFMLAVLLPACAGQATTSGPSTMRITVRTDGKALDFQIPAGTSVQQVLDQGGIQLSNLDRVDPPAYTVLARAEEIRVIRVREEFEVKENILPFERQTVKNEALPLGQTLLIQPGENGLQQITSRRVFEDGQEVSFGVFKVVTLREEKPEIVMVGVQTPFSSVSIPGKLVYLTAGNAWLMQEDTGKRRPVVTSSDLDGRVFSLSPDGSWLLYTRKAAQNAENAINSLWAVHVTDEKPQPVNLQVNNIIHYAGWVPGSILAVAYSTVEPRSAAPGWQANNDLHVLTFTASGGILRNDTIIETNSGGLYGWWGTLFAWSPDGTRLAYARPDSVGLVDLENKQFTPLLDLLPYQTRSDWAWVPSIAWSPDNLILYTVNHAPEAGRSQPEESSLFDLLAIPVRGGPSISLIRETGMFSYPVPSEMDSNNGYQVAYLQATFPKQSETSNYRLALMDRDGSNKQIIFPAEGLPGMNPQQIIWSPPGFIEPFSQLGVLYQGNLWFVDPKTAQTLQITGDGSISRVDWK